MTIDTTGLTRRQQEILAFIRHALENEGRPPTRAEVCRAFGFKSPNAAESHLRALAAKGAITLEEGRARGIRLPGGFPRRSSAFRDEGLPLIGHVAAGNPILAIEHIESHHPIDPSLFSPRADYLLRVKGLSMRDAGILDGDLLAIHRSETARNGQVVVARVRDDVTVKTFSARGKLVSLLPANPDFEPITVDTEIEPLAIEGLVVGLIRNGLPG